MTQHVRGGRSLKLLLQAFTVTIYLGCSKLCLALSIYLVIFLRLCTRYSMIAIKDVLHSDKNYHKCSLL